MTYEKPKCEYENCEMDAEIEHKTVSIGEETRYHRYCFRHDGIVRVEESGESVENNEDNK